MKLNVCDYLQVHGSFPVPVRSTFPLSDFPNPPAQVGITGVLYPTNVTISWVYVARPYNPLVSTSVDHFVVELRTTGNTYFSAVANASSDATSATITGLIPYSTNYIRVSAVNGAGSTPSKVLTIATPTSG